MSKMALNSDSPTRANIRIEIKNDFQESMDEDLPDENLELSEGEVEDGEIGDERESGNMENEGRNKIVYHRTVVASSSDNQWVNGESGFMTGVDIFAKDEQEKLQTRAQRFGLDLKTKMTEEQLQELYTSLGITSSDQEDIRYETIHMYGTQDMSTQDIFAYFGKYGPASIEWINDTACNVVWHDRVSAARAFIALSKPIAGMPVTGDFNPYKDDKETKMAKGRSILLVNPDEHNKENDDLPTGIVHVSEITIPIPPGYWRLGYPHEKSEYILLRFAKLSDKKPLRAERFNEYYKKYGNSNFKVGLISESRKRKIRDHKFEEPEVLKGNPWGNLARNWNRDIQEPIIPRVVEKPIIAPTNSLVKRLGETPQREDTDEEEKQKIKKPRMRMYADEEEARVRKQRELKQIKVLEEIAEEISKKVPDLRTRLRKRDIKEDRRKLELRRPNYKSTSEDSEEEEEEEIQVQQRSKVAVVIRKPHKPTVASTVWSRLDRERERKKIEIKQEKSSESSSSESDSESEESENDRYRKTLSKTVGERPGFKTVDLKSRLGFPNTEHKSPLRIEINNDHYKKEKK